MRQPGDAADRADADRSDESGQWRVSGPGDDLDRFAEGNQQARDALEAVESELELVRRQQRYQTLQADVARRLAERREWNAGQIGDTDEYGVSVPDTVLPLPAFAFVRFLEADDTVEYTIFHPRLSYVRLSLSGLSVSSSALETLGIAAGSPVGPRLPRQIDELQVTHRHLTVVALGSDG